MSSYYFLLHTLISVFQQQNNYLIYFDCTVLQSWKCNLQIKLSIRKTKSSVIPFKQIINKYIHLVNVNEVQNSGSIMQIFAKVRNTIHIFWKSNLNFVFFITLHKKCIKGVPTTWRIGILTVRIVNCFGNSEGNSDTRNLNFFQLWRPAKS